MTFGTGDGCPPNDARCVRCDRSGKEVRDGSPGSCGWDHPLPTLLRWLIEHDVEHEVHEHHVTVRAMETARAEGIDPRRFAKTVVLMADGHAALVVVDALDRVDLEKAAAFLAADSIRLATEEELRPWRPAAK